MFYLGLRYLRMILILIQVFHYNEAKHFKRRLRWDCFDCQMGPQYTDRMTCQIGGTRRTLLNVELKLLTELDQIKVYIKISTRFKSSTSYRKFFDITFDGCRVISDMDHGTMASNVFNAVVKSSNQPRKCPIKEGSIYYHNISVEDALPMFVPSAQLFIQLDFYSRRQLYLNVSLRGEIIE